MVKALRRLAKKFSQWLDSFEDKEVVDRDKIAAVVTRKMNRIYPGLSSELKFVDLRKAAMLKIGKGLSKSEAAAMLRPVTEWTKEAESIRNHINMIVDSRLTGRPLFIVTENKKIQSNVNVLKSAFPEIAEICSSAERPFGFDHVQGT